MAVGTSTKALFKGIETWKKETIMKKVIQNFHLQLLVLLLFPLFVFPLSQSFLIWDLALFSGSS